MFKLNIQHEAAGSRGEKRGGQMWAIFWKSLGAQNQHLEQAQLPDPSEHETGTRG